MKWWKKDDFGLNSREFYIPPNPNFPDYFSRFFLFQDEKNFSKIQKEKDFSKIVKNSKIVAALIVVYSKSIVFA